MPISDYAHWNEDAEYMWWHEEGKHIEEPPEPDDDFDPRDQDDNTHDHEAPHDCLKEGNMNFVAHIAAPGYGQAWVCDTCEHPFTKIGDTFHDAETTLFELRPEDVI
jgi:hypothetical protein